MVGLVAKYQRYEEYKDSGVEWLGEIPKGWELTKLKYLISSLESGCSVNAADISAQDYEIGVLKTSCVYTRSFRIEENKTVFIEDLHRVKCKVRKGAIIISRMNTPELVGASALVDVEAANIFLPDRLWQTIFNQEVEINSEYLANFMIIKGFRDQIALGAEGASSSMQNIAKEDYLNINCVFPTFKEQIQIANFLDHETAKIDSLIEKQQQLIQLLKEKRQAVISHAVTKGLDPSVKMKDSGVEWLGEVPEHWSATKIKYVAELTPKKSELSNSDNRLCTFVPMEKLKLGSLVKDEEKQISEVIGGYTYFKDGDLLLAKVTPCFENKNMVIANGLKNGIGFGSSEIYVLRTNYNVNAQFLYYRLQENQFMELGTGAMTGAGGLKRVPSEFLNNFEFALPPLSEQITIFEYLNQYLIKNEYLIDKAESAIQLMQERRTALISAAVTGKIDVRNWQNPTEAKMECSA